LAGEQTLERVEVQRKVMNIISRVVRTLFGYSPAQAHPIRICERAWGSFPLLLSSPDAISFPAF
jgi:hypothetical protein